jgi:hypothetical protein
MSLNITNNCKIFKIIKSVLIDDKYEEKWGYVIEINGKENNFLPINNKDNKKIRQKAIIKAKKEIIKNEFDDPKININKILNNDKIKKVLNY